MKPFQYGGRRGMKELLAPRLIWDSSKQGPAGRFAKPFPPRAPGSKRARGWLDSGGDGLRSTRRLRRYGGLQGIEAARADQLNRLKTITSDETPEATRDLAKAAWEFLQGNRLRVLNVAPWSVEPDAVETWAQALEWE